MIIFCAADKKYFDLYFDLWAGQLNKYYPNERKIIALYQGTSDDIKHAADMGVEVKDVTNDKRFPSNPTRNHFYMLRWLHLPHEHGATILETQINCLAVKTQVINIDNWGVDHVRISRWKVRKSIPVKGQIVKGQLKAGGISAAVFTPEAAKKVTEQAAIMINNAPENDHKMNEWQALNLSNKKVFSEQKVPHPYLKNDPDTCWITSLSSTTTPVEEKLKSLKHYISRNYNYIAEEELKALELYISSSHNYLTLGK